LTAEANTVKMFTTTWCGFCKGTKRYLDSKGVAYEEIDIEQFPEYGERIEPQRDGQPAAGLVRPCGRLHGRVRGRGRSGCPEPPLPCPFEGSRASIREVPRCTSRGV
jgi:glutaredoxin-related protein